MTEHDTDDVDAVAIALREARALTLQLTDHVADEALARGIISEVQQDAIKVMMRDDGQTTVLPTYSFRRAACRRCDQPITELFQSDNGRGWRHDSDGSRGCRAATFDRGSGWDDSIPRSWKAAPLRGSIIDQIGSVTS
jgi:hypothetical protein